VIKDRASHDRSSHTRISNGTVDDGCWGTRLGAGMKKLCARETDQTSDWSNRRLRHEQTGPL